MEGRPLEGMTFGVAGKSAAVQDGGEVGGGAFYRVTQRKRLETRLAEVQLYVREADAPCVHRQ